MSEYQNIGLKPDRFATAAANLLYAAFLNPSRAQAKRHFARVQGGALLDLETLRIDNGTEVLFRVGLDHSAYRGKLSFTTFRRSLGLLLNRLAERIRTNGDMNIYSAEDNTSLIFNVPAVIQEEGQINVMMLGVDEPQPGVMTLRLTFFDTEQFKQS